MSDNKNKKYWSSICEDYSEIPVFLQPWWWDITCGKSGWEIAMSFSPKGTPQGAMLYEIKTNYGIRRLTLPPFTPFNGIWLRNIDTSKAHSLYSKRRKIITQILEELPRASMQDFKIHYALDDWLPFKWKGYNQTTQYTQTLDITAEEEEIYAGLKSATRSKIKRASSFLKLISVKDINRFIEHIQAVFSYKKIKFGNREKNIIRTIDKRLTELDKKEIYAVQDKDGHIHAMIYLIFTGQQVHYWLGGASPAYRNEAGMYLLLWEAIKKSRGRAKCFDFDGSNHPNIAPVFTGFGAIPKGYHYIYRSNGWMYRLLRLVRRKDG